MSRRHFDTTDNAELRAKIDEAKWRLPMPVLALCGCEWAVVAVNGVPVSLVLKTSTTCTARIGIENLLLVSQATLSASQMCLYYYA
jgi:hypothetical protein